MEWVYGHKIFKRLRITGINNCLDISNYSDNNDNIFSLKLTDTSNNKLLYSEIIGYVEKNCRILNLRETHELICNKEHKVSHCHDPVTDVVYTRCIFNYIINVIRPRKLFKLCK